jgi:hypothetical protein
VEDDLQAGRHANGVEADSATVVGTSHALRVRITMVDNAGRTTTLSSEELDTRTLAYIVSGMQAEYELNGTADDTRSGSQTIQLPLYGDGPECAVRIRYTAALMEKIERLESRYISRVIAHADKYSAERPLSVRKASALFDESMEQLFDECETVWRFPGERWQPMYYPHQLFVRPLAGQMFFIVSHCIDHSVTTLCTAYLRTNTLATLAPRPAR